MFVYNIPSLPLFLIIWLLWTPYVSYSKLRSLPSHIRNVPGWSPHAITGPSFRLIHPPSGTLISFHFSRLKKIKCVQVKSHPRCEACETGNTPCQFRDRERYFAERSRIVTGASASPSPAHSRRSSTQSTEHSAVPSTTRGDSLDASSWYSATPTSSSINGHPSRYASSSPSYSLSSSPQSNPDQWFSSPLIEPARPHYERSVCPQPPRTYDMQRLTCDDPGNMDMLPYLNLATAPLAGTMVLTMVSRIRQAHNATARRRGAKSSHYLILAK
jgi:hypothetical protein